MKRKYADRPNWSRIIDKSYTSIFIDEQNYYGHVAYLSLNKVREPLWVTYEANRLCIVDDGYVWLQHFPIHGQFVLTSTYDQEGRLIQCYFDIVKSVGASIEGIPYCDDLYIDVVALPNGEVFVLDEDELDDALRNNDITKEEHEYAKFIASELVTSLKEGRNYLLNSTERYYRFLKDLK
ncbi:DUF402 domain-containing protein [Fontibacillus sp. BL9]|uniref:DUF402 domain-containing protein n=1 Tax=Fontibacillus sp. BL9 TaxID=3389971 RepID=UPI003978D37B